MKGKRTLALAVLAALLALVPAAALADMFAVVRGGRLNLREYPSTSSRSLGKYASGSWVRMVKPVSDGAWWSVRTMDGKSGYMATAYLDQASGSNQGTVRYANGGYVNLRSGPSLNNSVIMRVTSGSTVYIQDESYEWNYVYVLVNGAAQYGYMHDSLIDKGTTTATVTTRNGGRVNLRSGPSSSYGSVGTLASGTRVTVLKKGNGWYHISANGLTGFMSTQYLSGTGSTVGSNTGGTTTSRVAYVSNPRSTQVLNLRESPSQSARSIGQYRNGTQVKVVSYGPTWCEVYVGTRHGYMMTRYLSFDGSYSQPSYSQPSVTSTPVYIYVTPTPSPTPYYIYTTSVPSYPSAASTPSAGTKGALAVRAGSGETMVSVYNDSSLASLKAQYTPGTAMTILSYGESVCMILIDGGVAYVYTGNVVY